MGAAFLRGRGWSATRQGGRWLRLAADQGDAGGQRNLALCYYEGWGVPQDQARRPPGTRKPPQQGDGDAQDMLSWMKLVGGGCDQSTIDGARRWAEKAAAQGKAAAMARLGDIHHNALGVERDPAQAARGGAGGAPRPCRSANHAGGGHLAGMGVERDLGRGVALVAARAGTVARASWRPASCARPARFTKPSQRAEAERRAALPLEADR